MYLLCLLVYLFVCLASAKNGLLEHTKGNFILSQFSGCGIMAALYEPEPELYGSWLSHPHAEKETVHISGKRRRRLLEFCLLLKNKTF